MESILILFLLLANFALVPSALLDRNALAPVIMQVGLILFAMGAVLVFWRMKRRNFWLWLLIPAYSVATFVGNVAYTIYYRG